jgi:cytoskeleton protein RodZ
MLAMHMDTVGSYLKDEREARKISLDEVSRATKIRRAILEAVERDEGEVFLPEVVVKGFIEAYARYLGLDPKEVLSAYPRGQHEVEAEKRPKGLREEKRRVPVRYMIAGAISLLVVIGVLVFLFGRTPQQGANEAVKDVAADAGLEETTPLKETQIITHAPSVEESIPSTSLQVPQTDITGIEEQQEEPLPHSNHTLVIKASEKTWVQIQEGSSLPFDLILYPGDSYSRTSPHRLAIVVGNAGGVTVTFDGQVLKGLGKAGEVVRLTLPFPEQG